MRSPSDAARNSFSSWRRSGDDSRLSRSLIAYSLSSASRSRFDCVMKTDFLKRSKGRMSFSPFSL